MRISPASIAKAPSVAGETSARDVADAFLSSLSSRRLDWRSALGSYAILSHLKVHALELGGLGSRQSCTVCGEFLDSHDEDWSVQNFERHKWGGVRHPQVPYAAFDLQQFKAAAPPRPSDNDVAIFRELLRAIEAASPDTTADKLHKHLGPMLKPNKDERDILIAILGIAGILETKEHPGFLLRFIRADERHIPSRRFIDMSYPACWWRRSDGVNHEAVSYWLGHRLENG